MSVDMIYFHLVHSEWLANLLKETACILPTRPSLSSLILVLP